jgi:hypothetical protein
MRKLNCILLLLVIITRCTDAAYVVLKNGKEGHVNVHDTATLYSPKKGFFFAEISKGDFYLEKRSIKYMVTKLDRCTHRKAEKTGSREREPGGGATRQGNAQNTFELFYFEK